jgi:predicted ATP-grasp superfamily ATP-dependent carboligase
MAEFKYDAITKDYKLIEINPKLCGSLDLTIEAGINVPRILIQSALNTEIDCTSTYQYVKYRWVFPDEFKVLISKPSIKALRDFVTREPNTLTNICFSDPLPTMFQIARSFVEGLGIMLDSNIRYPHGRRDS